ncbi:MAG: AgmX/PglI C-terminal domain-containing protein [Polyangiaceae bacterium]
MSTNDLHQHLGPMLLGLALLLPACSGAKDKDAENPDADGTATTQSTKPRNQPTVEAEVGALDNEAVDRTYQKSLDAMLGCVNKALDRLPYLAGDVTIYLRVNKEGKLAYAYLENSTLGDRATESCILNVLSRKTWPAPVGGNEGFAHLPFNLEKRGGVREPTQWSASDAGKTVDAAREAAGKCAREVSAGPMKLTIHVDTDGNVIAAGASGSDKNAERAADCAVDAIRKLKFDSPGSYPAVLTLSVP